MSNSSCPVTSNFIPAAAPVTSPKNPLPPQLQKEAEKAEKVFQQKPPLEQDLPEANIQRTSLPILKFHDPEKNKKQREDLEKEVVETRNLLEENPQEACNRFDRILSTLNPQMDDPYMLLNYAHCWAAKAWAEQNPAIKKTYCREAEKLIRSNGVQYATSSKIDPPIIVFENVLDELLYKQGIYRQIISIYINMFMVFTSDKEVGGSLLTCRQYYLSKIQKLHQVIIVEFLLNPLQYLQEKFKNQTISLEEFKQQLLMNFDAIFELPAITCRSFKLDFLARWKQALMDLDKRIYPSGHNLTKPPKHFYDVVDHLNNPEMDIINKIYELDEKLRELDTYYINEGWPNDMKAMYFLFQHYKITPEKFLAVLRNCLNLASKRDIHSLLTASTINEYLFFRGLKEMFLTLKKESPHLNVTGELNQCQSMLAQLATLNQ